MDTWNNPQDEKLFGLKNWQLDLAFFLLIGVAALGAYLFGGAHALGILDNDEAASPQPAAVEAVAPVASSVVQAPTSEGGETANSPSAPDANENPDAIHRAEALFLGVLAVLIALVTPLLGVLGVLVALMAPFPGVLAVLVAFEAPFLGVLAVFVAFVTAVAVLTFIGGDGTDNAAS